MIVAYNLALAPYFESLNREWIERWYTVEPKDEWYFRDPHSTIIAPGGTILFALEAEVPIGVAAAIRRDAATFELAKMAVTPAFQGRGYGRALAEGVVQHATHAGAHRVIILSDSRLESAVRLYERLGFEHRPFPTDTGYSRGNVYMVLELPQS
jgi:GNAT superfamily N-acetyltransferase